MRGHEIKFLVELGQGSLSLNPADDARNIEQLSRCPEKRLVVDVESENVVAEIFADVKEVAGPTAEIENVQRLRAVEPKVLGALDVDVDPINDVFEAIDLRGAGPIRILVAQAFELKPVDVIQQTALIDGMR